MPRDVLPLVQKALGDRYILEREIGRGATARIFLAHDAAGRQVALKMLLPELLVDTAAERFLREMRVAARLDHPRIARLLDSGEQGWLVWYAMALVEGPTLRAHLESHGPLDVTEALRLAGDVLDALAHAHAHDVVHRDVKPDNIALTADGAVLLDFGIARAIGTAGGDRVTRAGTAVGSPAYMSPEQARGEQELDARSDLYAVGCVLFECLAGTPPFTHPNPAVLLSLHQTAPVPDLRARRPDVPPALAEAIARALAKTPAERWASATAMREALGPADPGAALAGSTATAHPTH